jgi:hypothetical protein
MILNFIMHQIILIIKPLLLFKPMAQSRRGVTQAMEAQVHPLAVAIPRFIRIVMPLPLLKLMDQSRRALSVGALVPPPKTESPHAVIEPSALRAAKALLVE